MNKDLTTSDIHRNNVLNNKYAIEEVEKEISFPGILFESVIRYTKKQVADFFEIDLRTIERYLDQYENEFISNGYEVLSSNRLKGFKDALNQHIRDKEVDDDPIANGVADIDVGNIAKVPKLGVFDFRAFLNLGMLLTESDRAKQLRALILDIVIDTLNQKLGGNTKYINQREDEFLPSAIREFNYRQAFTDALDECIVDNKWKYPQFTDAVYKSIFHEDDFGEELKIRIIEAISQE